jgi:hypothetical protein
MRVDEKATAEARKRHEEGIARLDSMFEYDRTRDGNGFLLASRLRMFSFKKRMRVGQSWRPGK